MNAELAHLAIFFADMICHVTTGLMVCILWEGHWQPVLATVVSRVHSQRPSASDYRS
jgi:hypothetical protein